MNDRMNEDDEQINGRRWYTIFMMLKPGIFNLFCHVCMFKAHPQNYHIKENQVNSYRKTKV